MAAVCVFCASSRTLHPRYLDLARATGDALARRGHTLVSGGGRVGMMGEVAAATRSAGGHTVGIIPEPLLSAEVADIAADELLITGTMAERKTLMMDKSDAFLVLPGGIGTLDELFEVWTTGWLAHHTKPVVLLDHEGFYAGLLGWLRGLIDHGMVHADAYAGLVVARSVAEALDAIEAATV